MTSLTRKTGALQALLKKLWAAVSPLLLDPVAEPPDSLLRIKINAVSLAFAVAAVNGKIRPRQIKFIKKWTRDSISKGKSSRQIDRALRYAVKFWRKGYRMAVKDICEKLLRDCSLAHRHDVTELCLDVVRVKGCATAADIDILKKIAGCLNVDRARFRGMAERILPAYMHRAEDAELLVGITSDMTAEQKRLQLNQEYRKWNSRVTSSDPQIRRQADQILKFIAKTRQNSLH